MNSTVTPAAAASPAMYFFASYQHGAVADPLGAASPECRLTITRRSEGGEPVARFTRPSSFGSVADEMLHANGWRALEPWEHTGRGNTYRTRVEPLRPYVTGTQAAARAVEERPARDTLQDLDAALCAMPVDAMDDVAETFLHDAIRAVSLAEDTEEWAQLGDVRRELAVLVADPRGATMEHPAVKALIVLLARCMERSGRKETDRPRWEGAYSAGLTLLRNINEVINSAEDPRVLSTADMAFLSRVEHAIVSRALYETREALAATARAYGLFVIGMRQPAPEGSWADWTRRIGGAVYRFEVVPPFMDGGLHGAFLVRRVAEDGTQGPARFFPRSPDEKRSLVDDALSRL
ncbi:hypothetical protein [Streptomyces roseolus]|uniref:hypothetical protein n=1 Tax=Streptomyces roseolus TaxID=67358 RepID=UPI00378C2AF0